MNNTKFFPLSSFIVQALETKKINIESKSNNIYSFCFLDNLTELTLKIMFENKSIQVYKFDAVNTNLSLLDLASSVAKVLEIEKKDITYNFINNHPVEKYIGNKDEYEKILNQYKVTNEPLSAYIEKVIKDIKKNL